MSDSEVRRITSNTVRASAHLELAEGYLVLADKTLGPTPGTKSPSQLAAVTALATLASAHVAVADMLRSL